MALLLRDWLRASRGDALDVRDAQVIAQHVLKLSRTQLITQDTRVLSERERLALNAAAKRCAQGEPVAYITGCKEFYGLQFTVSPAVLVPRPETELLVELALQHLNGKPAGARVLDMGTGSGCIAISIAHQAPQAQHVHVTAVDVSAAALAVAQQNNRQLVQGRVRMLQSRWFDALQGERFDVIVSNPPYIAEGDAHLAALAHEPQTALTSGRDGLDALRHIIAQAPLHLQPGGTLWLEHGYDQATTVRQLLEVAGFAAICSHADLAGIARATGGVWCNGASAPQG
jgi:release factor glutamine methyltransferase